MTSALGARDNDIRSRMLRERILFVTDPLDDVRAADLTAALLHLDHDRPDKDISIYITSIDATFSAATMLYDGMQAIDADIRTVCLGQAGGSAALLLAAGTPGKRLIAPSARVILREPVMDTMPGSAADFDTAARELLQVRALITTLLAQHTGQSTERIDRDLRHQTILAATEAITYGLADHLVATRANRHPEPR